MTVRTGSLLTGVATAAAVAVLLRLSAWQWDRATTRESALSYAYAVEWLVLAVALVVVVLRRRARPADTGDEGSRDVHGRLVGPPLRPGETLPEPIGVRLRRRLTLRRGRPRF